MDIDEVVKNLGALQRNHPTALEALHELYVNNTAVDFKTEGTMFTALYNAGFLDDGGHVRDDVAAALETVSFSHNPAQGGFLTWYWPAPA